MKKLMMMILVLGGSLMADASTANADHRWHGGRGSSFSISVGNGFNGFSYSQGNPRGFYGRPYGGGYGYGNYYSVPVYSTPVYRTYPAYSVPVYGGYSGFGGHHRHCH